MKYKEVIKLLEKHFESVDNFAYHDFGAPDDFVASDDVEEAERLHTAAYEAYSNFNVLSNKTSRNTDKKDKDELERLREVYFNTPGAAKTKLNEFLVSIGIGPIDEIDSHGGEDMGSDWYSIKHLPQLDMYIKVSGWYQSHHGTDFDGWDDACSEVKPQTKTITVYE